MAVDKKQVAQAVVLKNKEAATLAAEIVAGQTVNAKVKDLLSPHEHKRVIILIFLVIIMAFFEMLGLASILPFIAVLSNPEVLETNNKLNLISCSFD